MNFKVDVECSPEEARIFLGLPNLAPMQDRIMKEIEDRMLESMRSLTPEEMMKTWMPATVQGWSELQKLFWSQLGINPQGAGGKSSASGDKSADKSKSKA